MGFGCWIPAGQLAVKAPSLVTGRARESLVCGGGEIVKFYHWWMESECFLKRGLCGCNTSGVSEVALIV
jgi:hypothetical protein